MTRRRLLAVALLAALPLASAFSAPTGPQTTLPKEALTIVTQDGKRHVFQVEVARSPTQQETGLMFRTSVAPDGGMLFLSPQPIRARMWMKNTLVPLDMLFIGADGRVVHLAENTVPQSLAVIDGRKPSIAVLELAGGSAARLGILVGDKVTAAGIGPTP